MLFTIVAFFVVLGILVIVHEIGHYFVTIKFGVKAEEFGFGLPPRIVGVFKDENGKWRLAGPRLTQAPSTIWSLNWIPMGGFVRIKGEEGGGKGEKDSFASQSVFKRILIVSAGVFMNFVLAAVLLTISLTFGSPQVIDEANLPAMAKVTEAKIRITEVLPASPAQRAGLQIGDTLLSIDGSTFKEITSLQDYINQKVGQGVNLKIQRDQQTLDKQATPEILTETKKGGLGVALVKIGFVSYPWYVAWWYGIASTVEMAWAVVYGFYVILQNLVVQQQMVGDVYGPIGIATLVGDAARMGFLYILQFTASLSVIIAVINFLPFPALDGGRVFFLLIEAIRRKPVNQKLETAMHNIGFALLMILIVIVTFRDIARISTGFLNWWQQLAELF